MMRLTKNNLVNKFWYQIRLQQPKLLVQLKGCLRNFLQHAIQDVGMFGDDASFPVKLEA